ncbi:MAG: putative 5-formyltetrahydrofolate cyclo-ligase [Planctomycetaceae bacterium]|nr:putative 5-formyltetrahydrofolate cyclo-ligase [Planctomycetaceae bacterium]
MPTQELTSFQLRKREIREQAHANRKEQPDKDAISAIIVEKFLELPEYETADTVMFYVDVRTEVKTRDFLSVALLHGKKVVVPFCRPDGHLELFWLQNMNELSVGMYKILEPKAELRGLPEKKVEPEDLDLVMVPGVAFDRNGARMGHGFGYYDKLLEHTRATTPLVALAFECQLFEEIPTADHDIFMDKIITEAAIYQGRGRSESI